jgi:hypothetical protein
MTKYFHFRNPASRNGCLHIVVASNQIAFDPPLGFMHRMRPFSLGRYLFPLDSIPIVTVGKGGLAPIMDQSDAIFAEAELAQRMQRELKDLIQVFEIYEMRTKDPRFNDFRLINLTRKIDCIDFDRSEYEMMPRAVDPVSVGIMRNLVLDEAKIPRDALFFRVARAEDFILVSDAGREKLVKAGVPDLFFGSEIFSQDRTPGKNEPAGGKRAGGTGRKRSAE